MSKKLLKNVSFRNNKDELKLLEHANSKRNFSEWVKQKLEEDLFNHPIKYLKKDTNPNIDDDLF